MKSIVQESSNHTQEARHRYLLSGNLDLLENEDLTQQTRTSACRLAKVGIRCAELAAQGPLDKTTNRSKNNEEIDIRFMCVITDSGFPDSVIDHETGGQVTW
jgi:hypothetical protein